MTKQLRFTKFTECLALYIYMNVPLLHLPGILEQRQDYEP